MNCAASFTALSAAEGASLIPARYNDPATSGLEYEISPDGPNEFEVKLTK